MSHRSVNERQFGEYTLRYSPPDMDTPRHLIRAFHPEGTKTTEGNWAGDMMWHPKTHEVTSIHIEEAHRRQGLATEMWKMGQELRPRPKHSSDRTDAGDAWARQVGGRLPRRQQNVLRGW